VLTADLEAAVAGQIHEVHALLVEVLCHRTPDVGSEEDPGFRLAAVSLRKGAFDHRLGEVGSLHLDHEILGSIRCNDTQQTVLRRLASASLRNEPCFVDERQLSKVVEAALEELVLLGHVRNSRRSISNEQPRRRLGCHRRSWYVLAAMHHSTSDLHSVRRWLRPAAALLLFGLAAHAASGQTGGPYRVGGAVTQPEPITQSAPVYTEEARKAGVQGVVIVEAIVDERGVVTNPRVLKGLPMGLDRKAIEAVQAWTFKPATLEGKPVPVYYMLTVEFKTDGPVQQGGQAPALPAEAGATKPEKILGKRAVATEAAVKAGVWGDVIVDVEVDEKGNVVDARVVRGLPMGLDRQALDTVRTWKFKPATQDGRAVKARTNVTVTFAQPASPDHR
jgi:TonB family protein